MSSLSSVLLGFSSVCVAASMSAQVPGIEIVSKTSDAARGSTTRKKNDGTRMIVTDQFIRLDSGSGRELTTALPLMVVDRKRNVRWYIDDGKRTVTQMDGDYERMIAAAREKVGFQSRMETLSSNATDLGPGEKIAGYDTRKYRISSETRLTMGSAGQSSVTTLALVADCWITTAFPELQELQAQWVPAWVRQTSGAMPHGNAGMPKGFPLRCISRRVTTVSNASTIEETSDTEVTMIRRGVFDPSLFAPPQGYALTKLTDVFRKAEEQATKVRLPQKPRPPGRL